MQNSFTEKYKQADKSKKLNEVFEIIQRNCDKLVKERGRSSYVKASELLRLMLGVEAKKEELNFYVNRLYNHKPILPALRDELKRFGLIK
jgi:hypothetical protein